MNARAILPGVMALWLCSACSIEDQASGEQAEQSTGQRTGQRAGQEPRVKTRVLEVVCDPDSRSTPEELVPLVREVRARDGRSDRVWEVADQADCIAAPPAAGAATE
ncbi:MAG: hypothetical protein KJ703_10595 [Alphaproteobacteria bacterium]|nr:hypothetical protein [Alphaproteobacteria bacterium]